MDLDEFTDRMFAVERRLGLLTDSSADGSWWDAVRYDVHTFLYDSLVKTRSDTPRARPRPLPGRALAWTRRSLCRAILAWRIRLRKHEVLVLRAPRQLANNHPCDAAIDQFLELCPARMLIINTFPHYYHLPTRRLLRKDVIRPRPVEQLIEALRDEFRDAWDEAAVRRLIASRLSRFDSALVAYRRLIGSIRPRLIIMTQNGMEKALFAAAREAGIAVVEGQHGLIGYSHPAYSYPRGVETLNDSTFPDVFLTFSSYWLNTCFYPARTCIAIGNDQFAIRDVPAPTADYPVMFISADVYHSSLLPWVRSLAEALPQRHIIYKLHPNQRDASECIRRELALLKNVEVVDASASARDLLAKVSHVVLVQSTVALEALQAGRGVCILPIHHYLVHRDLFQFPGVTLTTDLDALVKAVGTPPPAGGTPSFFAPFDRSKATELMCRLLQTGSSGQIRLPKT